VVDGRQDHGRKLMIPPKQVVQPQPIQPQQAQPVNPPIVLAEAIKKRRMAPKQPVKKMPNG
jgi:hypothetical protein